MKVRSLNRTQQNLNTVFTEYNVKLRRKKTRTQLIIRTVFIFALLSFFSGVLTEAVRSEARISGLTGLNSGSTVVSAQERVNEFNPVKNKKVVVIIITDEENVKELLEHVRKIKE